jgi:hypothetical protein
LKDIVTAIDKFLAKVEVWAPGQSIRFAPALDDLIKWSEENAWGVQFTHHAGVHHLVKYCVPGVNTPFWSAVPRTGDGARFTLLNEPHQRFPEALRNEAREELCRIGGVKSSSEGVPEVAFTKLIWEPYRLRVLDLMTKMLNAVHGRV